VLLKLVLLLWSERVVFARRQQRRRGIARPLVLGSQHLAPAAGRSRRVGPLGRGHPRHLQQLAVVGRRPSGERRLRGSGRRFRRAQLTAVSFDRSDPPLAGCNQVADGRMGSARRAGGDQPSTGELGVIGSLGEGSRLLVTVGECSGALATVGEYPGALATVGSGSLVIDGTVRLAR
jgi:hypothetical protein